MGTEAPASVKAYAEGSDLTSAGGVTINTKSNADIDSEIVGAATTIGFSVDPNNNTAVTVGAIIAMNRVSTSVDAHFSGGTINARGGSVRITGRDESSIDTDSAATSVGVSASTGSSKAITLGLTLGRNQINSSLDVSAVEAALSTTTIMATGDLEVSAVDSSSINSKTTSTAVSPT